MGHHPHQGYAIEMALHWWADDGPTLTLYFCDFSGGSRPTVPTLPLPMVSRFAISSFTKKERELVALL